MNCWVSGNHLYICSCCLFCPSYFPHSVFVAASLVASTTCFSRHFPSIGCIGFWCGWSYCVQQWRAYRLMQPNFLVSMKFGKCVNNIALVHVIYIYKCTPIAFTVSDQNSGSIKWFPYSRNIFGLIIAKLALERLVKFLKIFEKQLRLKNIFFVSSENLHMI